MAVLVTGALGHIGMWVATRLLEEGDEVIAFDRNMPDFDRLATDELKAHAAGISRESGDVTDPATVAALFDKHAGRIDGVIHIASIAGVPEFIQRPRHFLELNIMGTVNVLDAARTHGVKKVTFISSGAVYGTREGPMKESDCPTPSDLYGASKLAGEELVLKYGDTYGMETVCTRVYFVYGPGRRPDPMFPIYRWAFGPLDGVTGLTNDSGADQPLDFTHVFDTAQGIVKAYRALPTKSRIYNVTSGVAVRLGDVVDWVADHLGTETGVKLGPGKAVPRGAPLDITRAKAELGFEPRFADIRDGIRQYHDWLKTSNHGKA